MMLLVVCLCVKGRGVADKKNTTLIKSNYDVCVYDRDEILECSLV